jgi:hypothetical protein
MAEKFFLEGGGTPRRDEKSTERTDSMVVMSRPSRRRVRKGVKIKEIVRSAVLGQIGREQRGLAVDVADEHKAF